MAGAPTRLGLISDTHMPQRWAALPDSVARVFAEVDLILHAGDVGELCVLDELGQIAPVVAVHGNDETPEAAAALPYRQILGIYGHRIALTHSHHLDPEHEAALRRDASWQSKLAYLVSLGRNAGADIVVFGHTHIPMVSHRDGVWLINPGAIASPSWSTRQTVQSVAVLSVGPGDGVRVEHFDVNHPERPLALDWDWDAGFYDAWHAVSTPIFDPELYASLDWLRQRIWPLAPAHVEQALLPLAQQCWSGERAAVGVADVVAALGANPATPPEIVDALRLSPVFGPYLVHATASGAGGSVTAGESGE